MRICPNLNDPFVRERWEALENDPKLGRIEAMRELIAAEKEQRAIGTPDEVKARLNEQASVSDAIQQARINKETAELLAKTNDPVYDDPDTLTGLAILNTANSKELSVETTSNTRAMEVLNKLSEAVGVGYAFVTPEEAIKITASSKNPYNVTKGPAFFYGDTVYFVGQAVNTEIAFHEFSHPLVRAIKNVNPILFEKLVNNALAADPTLLQAAYAEYQDLKDQVTNEADPDLQRELEQRYKDTVAEEVLVKALTKQAMVSDKTAKTGLAKIVNDILFAIKQFLRTVLGRKINISKLSVNTTLDELAEMLVKGGKFDINTDNVRQADVVSYYEGNAKYIEELKNISKKSGNQEILAMTRRMYEGASQQVRLIMNNKNYSEMINLFADEYNRGDLQEIRSNLKKYAVELEGKTAELAEDIERTRSEIQALVNSMLRLEVMMDKMEKHLKELSSDPNSQDNVKKAYYYNHILEYWQKYVAEAQSIMTRLDSDPKSPMNGLLNNIEKTMKRSAATITKMNHHGVAQILWEEWETPASEAEKLFHEQVETLKKNGASKQALDRRFIDFYGMPEKDMLVFKELKAKKEQGTLTNFDDIEKLESLEKASFNGQQITKAKIERGLAGEGRDAHWANSYLEGYLYNTDPVIGGFAMYYKNNLTEMEARVQARYNDIVRDLDPLLKEAGIKFNKIGELGTKIGFVDNIGYFDNKLGQFVKKEVWTLLNPYKDYRYDVDKFNHDIKEANNRYNKTGNAEDKKALETLLAEKAAHMRKYFHQQYVDEYYAKDDLLERDEVGRKAAYERKKIIEEINTLVHPLVGEYDILKVNDEIEALWKQYRLLYSLYYPNGNKKEGEDLAIAERLQEHREHARKFYEFKERSGVFQNSLKNFEAETRELLREEGVLPNSEEFEDRFEAYRNQWIQRNTRIAIKPEFYAKRTEILNRIKAITSKLPSTAANDINFSEHWKTILDVVSGYRDDDGQPNGGQMSDGRKAKVKEAQQAMEEARNKWAGFSGLTKEQMETLVDLAAKKNSGERLTPEEFDTYIDLIKVKDQLGLDEYDRAELNSLFADLKELQRKEPTPYYLESLNYWLETMDTNELYKEYGITEFTADNVYLLNNPKVLKALFEKSSKFQDWFEKNHIAKKIFNIETKQQETVYERLYVWNVIKPNNPSFYESTQITNDDGSVETIPGLPTLKYYARVVKKQYRTGYDPATGLVKPIVGVHVSNQGKDDYLPKQIEGSPYINEEYFRLKNAPEGSDDNKLFKVLEKITEVHLQNQEGLGKRAKLYLDFPRFEKSNLEVIQSGGIAKKAKETGNFFSIMFKRFRDFIQGAKADAGDEFNYKQENMLVRADAFGDQIENIPIQGIFNLDKEETSTDIITSMFRYMYGAENHKQLVKMNPVAQGLKNIVNDPDNVIKETDKIDRSNFLNYGVVTYLNKKGKYIRREAVNNFYEREFMGKTQTGAFNDTPWIHNVQRFLFKRSSFAFFALNIPSALKNAGGAKFQAIIESAGGDTINPQSLAKGQAWSLKYMSKLSFGDAYAKGQRSLEHQIGEIFDPIQGRFREKLGESVTRTMGKDVASMSWLYNFRKWTEIEANMQTFGGMMYKQKIPMGNTEIDYMDAWELDDQGRIALKAGIDPKWGITYDEEGNQIIGEEFKRFKSRVHIVMNKLNGAYSRFDQPEMQRYLAFRFVSFLRRFFTTMAINRFGKRRWTPGYSQIDEGYYVTSIKALLTLGRSRNFHDLTREDRKAWMKMLTEIGSIYLMSFLIGAIWDWDDDDPDRYKKLRAKSGHMPFPFTSENKPGEEFDPAGFLSLHAMNLMMLIRSENEQFLPLPGYGADNIATMIDLKSLAFGPTTDTYGQIATDISEIWKGSDKQFYKRRVGPYEWQDEGGSKIWAHIAKSFGLSGSSVDVAQGITNFSKAQNRNR